MIEYSTEYNGYWRRADRVGTSSFASPEPIAKDVLRICGYGRILDIGCGMGALVRELLAHEVDAYGVDVSSVVAGEANRLAPGRFSSGSVLALPFADKSFDAVISTDCLEHIAPHDVPAALKEISRICRRHVFLRIATGPDRDNHWHLTIEGRTWWEGAAMAAGLRRHPGYFRVNDFESLENDPYSVTIPLERIPDLAMGSDVPSVLPAWVTPDGDLLSRTGREADARLARYALAARHVRPGAPAIDIGCGTGGGVAVLVDSSLASRVIGIDESAESVHRAKALYGTVNQAAEFVQANHRLAPEILPDGTLGTIVAMDQVNSRTELKQLVDVAQRWLQPGGVLVFSVRCFSGGSAEVQELGISAIVSAIPAPLSLVRVVAQSSGNSNARPATPRRMFEIRDPTGSIQVNADWWIIIARKAMADAIAADNAISDAYLRGLEEQKRGRRTEAIACYRECLGMLPSTAHIAAAAYGAEAAFRLGHLLWHEGDRSGAAVAWANGADGSLESGTKGAHLSLGPGPASCAAGMDDRLRLLDAIRRCTRALYLLPIALERPGLYAQLTFDFANDVASCVQDVAAESESILRQSLDQAHSSRDAVSAELAKTLESYSWKITAPLRILAESVKRLLR